MQMKYFQGVADIKNYYVDAISTLEMDGIPDGYITAVKKTRGIDEGEVQDFYEEYKAIMYLVCCRLEMSYLEHNIPKPSIKVMNRCLNRYLDFIARVHNCKADNYKQHPSRYMRNSYLSARHYLFKFSLPAWYAKLPDEILTYENKWGKRK